LWGGTKKWSGFGFGFGFDFVDDDREGATD
jgi:hypothetical protein